MVRDRVLLCGRLHDTRPRYLVWTTAWYGTAFSCVDDCMVRDRVLLCGRLHGTRPRSLVWTTAWYETAFSCVDDCMVRDRVLLYGRLRGTRPRERSNQRSLDNIRQDCVVMEMTIATTTRLARDRHHCNSAVAAGACRAVDIVIALMTMMFKY